MTLKPGDLPDERDAIWRGSMAVSSEVQFGSATVPGFAVVLAEVGQNGKSATLTAPNGIPDKSFAWHG